MFLEITLDIANSPPLAVDIDAPITPINIDAPIANGKTSVDSKGNAKSGNVSAAAARWCAGRYSPAPSGP